nr:hypothetical protein [Armatimonas sp.]
MSEVVALTLSRAEALVLFDFLTRFSTDGTLTIQDQAEECVLWDMCCDLESMLAEPFSTDYVESLQKARDAVRDKEG